MHIEKEIPLIESILGEWRNVIGDAYMGYRNHVYRMVHCCFALRECDAEEREKILIAACFHDIGIWAANTIDYIEPSVLPALDYLESHDKQAWSDEIRLMISEHHKLRAYTGEYEPLVELFRRADLADFSLGMLRSGLPRLTIRELKKAFPNAGFHKFLLRIASAWFIRHPLNPAPMMKW